MNLRTYMDELSARDWQDDGVSGSVRFAIIGLGGFALEQAMPAIEASDFCETTVVVSGSDEKARRVAAEFDAGHGITYEEFHAGEAVDAYDAVYIVTPNALHLEYAETAAALGKHVICEKPLESTADRAERMVDVCADNGVKLMTAYRMQTEPIIRRIRDLIADDMLGELVQLQGAFSVKSMTGDRGPDHWRYDPALAGGGALMDIGVYPLNTGRFILGMDPNSTQGLTTTQHEAFDGVDEHVSFELEFPGELTAACTASFNGQLEGHLQVVGIDGRVMIQSAFPTNATREVTIERDDAHLEITTPPVNEVREEFDYFAHAILTDGTIDPDGEDGLTDMRIMDAIYESAESGRRVDL